MSNPLAALLRRHCLERPDAPLLTTPAGAAWTYGDLDAASARLAHALVARGVAPGDRVAVQSAKSPELLALHVACARVGAVYLPMNDAYTEAEVANLVADAEPALVVREAGVPLRELAAEEHPTTFDDVDRDLDDPACMLYTSGTTGAPKGAVLSHRNLVVHADVLSTAWGFTADDVLVHVLPLFHVHGLFVAAHCVLATGGQLRLHPTFDVAATVADLASATVFMGVPTHYVRLLQSPDFGAGSVRLFTSGSAPMLVGTHLEVQERTGQTVLERYGMSETCILTSNPLVGARKAGTVGLPLPGVELRVVGELGAVEVRGETVFGGYWRRPDLLSTEFTEDGWFRTGDLGVLDDDGYVELTGRSKDLVISGGYNVHPKEVEQVLDSLDGVVESAVVGLPDPDLGERVVAAVVLAPGSTTDGAAIRLAARALLAAYKVPKQVVVLEDLPRNVMGKVQKNVLRTSLLP